MTCASMPAGAPQRSGLSRAPWAFTGRRLPVEGEHVPGGLRLRSGRRSSGATVAVVPWENAPVQVTPISGWADAARGVTVSAVVPCATRA